MLSKYIFIFLLLKIVKTEINIFPSLPITVLSENDFCGKNSKTYLENLDNFTLWAHEMRDASAQSATSVLRGSGFNLGNLEQCLTANAPFQTQYCLAVVIAIIPETKTPRDPYSLDFDPNESIINKLYDYKDETKIPRNVVRLGWCIPASCTPSDAENSLNKYLKNYNHPLAKENVSFIAAVPSVLCQTTDSKAEIDSYDLAFCTMTAILVLLVIVATVLDYNEQLFSSTKKQKPIRMLLAFSAKSNYNDLIKPDSSEKPMKILYGLKTLCIFAVIVGHRCGLSVNSPIINFDYVEENFRQTWSSALYHIDYFVDTFFFISGLLVTYVLLGLIEKKIFNPGMLILNRYMRLTPAYAFIIFFQATMLYHTGNGALWEPIVGQERKDCRESWWTGLLYISNFVNSEHMCMLQSWYLPCDFHFFLIAILLIFLLHKHKKIGFAGIVLCCLGTMIITFYITYVNDRPPYLRFLPNLNINPKSFVDFQLTYVKSYTRGLPYFIGMVAGYIYYTLKGTEYKISKFYSSTILLFSYFLICMLIFTGVIYYDPYHKYNALESAFYGSLHRLVWALATLGFVYAVSFGSEGFLFQFFSWKVFVPLSKLSYGAYLCHLAFQMRDIGSLVNPKQFMIYNMAISWISDIVISFAIAFVLYMMVEEPFKKILVIILSRKTKTNNLPKKLEVNLENSSKL